MESHQKNPRIVPKTHYYLPDGTGRDYYVKTDDGGLNRNIETRTFTGGKFIMKNTQRHHVWPIMEAKNIYYRSDGTGRDNYVIVDEGGLTKFNKSIDNYKYVSDLRNYQKQFRNDDNAHRPDFFQHSQHFKNRKQIEKLAQLKKSQKELTMKLSQPVKTDNPYQYPNVFDNRIKKKVIYR